MVELVQGDRVLARWPLAEARPDLSVIDDLARLQLVARRWGGSIRLSAPPDSLRELLHLTGLEEVLVTAEGLVVEVEGQPETVEEVDVEERVDFGDETT